MRDPYVVNVMVRRLAPKMYIMHVTIRLTEIKNWMMSYPPGTTGTSQASFTI